MEDVVENSLTPSARLHQLSTPGFVQNSLLNSAYLLRQNSQRTHQWDFSIAVSLDDVSDDFRKGPTILTSKSMDSSFDSTGPESHHEEAMVRLQGALPPALAPAAGTEQEV
jgi:hypothetical protein